MSNQSESDRIELRQHHRSFQQNRRSRNDSEDRGHSLINYDTKVHTKVLLPPVLAKARGSFPNEQYSLERKYSLSALDELVQCTICLDRFNQPKMLPCQHTFCLSCLEAEFSNGDNKNNKSFITCSTCGLKHELKDRSLNDLPSNLYIVSLLKVMSDKVGISGGSSSSPLMPKAELDLQLRCVKCETVCSVNENSEKCCRHCVQTFCTVCWDSHMVELNQQIKGFDNKLNTAIQKMNHKLEDSKIRCEKINKNINIFIDSKIEELQKKKNNLIDESQNIMNDSIESHKSIIGKIDAVKESIGICSANPNSDKVTFFMSTHRDITKILNEISLWGDERPSFNQKNLSIEVVETVSNEDLYEDDINNDLKKTVPALVLNRHDSVEEYYKKTEFKSKLLWTKCTRPTGVAIAPWKCEKNAEMLYIVGSDSKSIFAINKSTGRIIQKISYDHMICPHGIAFSRDREEIYVSDKWRHCIFIFSKAGQFLRFIGSKGDMEGYLRSPEGIAVGPNNSLYVCDTGNDRIQCLNVLDGKMIHQFGMIRRDALTSKRLATITELNSPTAIALYNDTIIVLDSGNKRVKTFNQKGEKIMEFGQSGSLKGYFKYPEVMAVDPHGFILVGDGGNCKIQIFQNNGQFVSSVGSRGSENGKFNWLSGIFVTEDLEIITSDYKNHTVQIFQWDATRSFHAN